jgi:hypothetical protein
MHESTAEADYFERSPASSVNWALKALPRFAKDEGTGKLYLETWRCTRQSRHTDELLRYASWRNQHVGGACSYS